MRPAPPTIADLRAERILAARVLALHSRLPALPFEAIGAPSGCTFIDLPKWERFVCQECGAREVHMIPDRPPYRAQG
jgi:hypothetical protein